MKKNTSKKAIWLRSLLVLPLFALLLYSFSEKEVVVVERPVKNDAIISAIKKSNFSNDIEISIRQDGVTEEQLSWYNSTIKKINKTPEDQRIFKQEDVQKLEHMYSLMSEKQRANAEAFPRFPPPPPMDTIYTYERLLKRIKTNPSNRTANIISLNKLYDNMNLSQREKVENPDTVKSLLPQDGATKKEISDYNTLAKKYNNMDPNSMRIEKSEVDRMAYIYSIMTEKQKKEAEAYPEIPPMPEPPMPPAPPMSNRLLAQEKALNKQEEKIRIQEKVLIEHEKKIRIQESQLMEHEKNIARLPAPPPPPTPKSPLDHVIEMAKKGATFYYEDKEISSDKAIEILKKNTNLNIDTRSASGKKPVVRLSKEPIEHTHNEAPKSLPAPTAANRINYLKVMHRHGAQFYDEDQIVSFTKALKIVRDNKKLHIETRATHSETPMVIISNTPFQSRSNQKTTTLP